jgi:hypothetical protein
MSDLLPRCTVPVHRQVLCTMWIIYSPYSSVGDVLHLRGLRPSPDDSR